jgi:hypothetical protein
LPALINNLPKYARPGFEPGPAEDVPKSRYHRARSINDDPRADAVGSPASGSGLDFLP